MKFIVNKIIFLVFLLSLSLCHCANRFNPVFSSSDSIIDTTNNGSVTINFLWQNYTDIENTNDDSQDDALNSTTENRFLKAPIFSAEFILAKLSLGQGMDSKEIVLINNLEQNIKNDNFLLLKKNQLTKIYSKNFLPDGNYNNISISLSAIKIHFPVEWRDYGDASNPDQAVQIEASLVIFFQDMQISQPDSEEDETPEVIEKFEAGQTLLELELQPDKKGFLFSVEKSLELFPFIENLKSDYLINFDTPLRVSDSNYPETNINLVINWEDKLEYEDIDYNQQLSLVNNEENIFIEKTNLNFPSQILLEMNSN